MSGESGGALHPETDARDRLIRNIGGDSMRIGQGYDVHRLVEGRKLIIGGVDIPYEKRTFGSF